MPIDRQVINTFFTLLKSASEYNGKPSDQYQLGYLNSVLQGLTTIPGVAESLLAECNRLSSLISRRMQDELESLRLAQKSVEVSTPKPETRTMIKTQNTQYKKTLRNELAYLGVDLNGFYYNDTCGSWQTNHTTDRRIKAEVSRPLTCLELGTLQGALGRAFDCKIDAKNYVYAGANCVVVYFRKK